MHDLMFTKEIISALSSKLKTLPNGSKITAVKAALSPLSHVKPETLIETYTAMVKDTEFENIALNITVLKLGIKCRSCKQEFLVDKPTMKCPVCNSADMDIVYNKEFVVESVEVSAR